MSMSKATASNQGILADELDPRKLRWLWRCLFRHRARGRGREMEPDKPFAGDAMSLGLRGGELPAASGFQCQVREEWAGAGRFKFRLGDVAGGVDFHADANTNDSLNRGASFF